MRQCGAGRSRTLSRMLGALPPDRIDVTVTEVRTSRDLSYATVYVQIDGDVDQAAQESIFNAYVETTADGTFLRLEQCGGDCPNAAGIEYDGQVTREGAGNAFNLNWDGTWQVESQIFAEGWSAEFEIPFRTLRYGKDDIQNWGINFQRNIRRNNEIVYWAPLERNRNLYRVSRAGTLQGIEPPSQRNLQFTPYALAQWRRGGDLDGTESTSEFGLDLKYGITPSLTLDLTYKTDFAQVEADEQQLNLDRFNLFFPEKRPFFLENAGQFAVGNGEEVEMFFSRRIGIAADGNAMPLKGGARLSGKIGERTNVGLLYMGTEAVDGVAPANDFAVVRINQELANRSSSGAIFVSRYGAGSFQLPSDQD